MDGRHTERDGEDERVEEHEEQPRALEEQEGPPDTGANGIGMLARAQSEIHEGRQRMGRPLVQSSTTADGAGMERLESRGSESSEVAVEALDKH